MENNNSLENEIDEMIEMIDEVLEPLEELLKEMQEQLIEGLINKMLNNDILKLDDEELVVIKQCLKMSEMLQDIMIESAKSMDNINEKLDTLLEIKNEEA